MVREFNDSDAGKTVVTADGDAVGIIEQIDDNMAHVKPNESLPQSVRRRLGWAENDDETFELAHNQVMDISDDEIRLNQ